MIPKSVKVSIAVLLSVLHVLVVCGEGYAAPTVKLIVSPNKTDVYLGSDSIVLTAKASGTNLTYQWSLQGPGEIEGEGAAVFYKLPKTIEGESAQAVVTVTVTDEKGEETTDSFTFNILKKEEPKPVATPEKKSEPQKKKGMSTTTKIAIGAGAVVGLGLIAAAVKPGEEEKKPFTGDFKRTYTTHYSWGTVDATTILHLKQTDNSISGSREMIRTFRDCCTLSFSVTASGTVEGNTARISYGVGEARCDGSGGCWLRSDYDGGTFDYTLIDNTILRSGNSDFIKQSLIGSCYSGDEEHIVETTTEEGEYIRQ